MNIKCRILNVQWDPSYLPLRQFAKRSAQIELPITLRPLWCLPPLVTGWRFCVLDIFKDDKGQGKLEIFSDDILDNRVHLQICKLGDLGALNNQDLRPRCHMYVHRSFWDSWAKVERSNLRAG